MFEGWMAVPIKGRKVAGMATPIKGYAVVRGYFKEREIAREFLFGPTMFPEEAYRAAAEMAMKLNG